MKGGGPGEEPEKKEQAHADEEKFGPHDEKVPAEVPEQESQSLVDVEIQPAIAEGVEPEDSARRGGKSPECGREEPGGQTAEGSRHERDCHEERLPAR